MILVFVVILAHFFGALACKLAAFRAAVDAGIDTGLAQVAGISEKGHAGFAGALIPCVVIAHTDAAVLAARHHGVELTALLAMVVFDKLALLCDLIAVAAAGAVHPVRPVVGAVLAQAALVAGIVSVQALAAAVAVRLKRAPVVGAVGTARATLMHILIPVVVTSVPAFLTVLIVCANLQRQKHCRKQEKQKY